MKYNKNYNFNDKSAPTTGTKVDTKAAKPDVVSTPPSSGADNREWGYVYEVGEDSSPFIKELIGKVESLDKAAFATRHQGEKYPGLKSRFNDIKDEETWVDIVPELQFRPRKNGTFQFRAVKGSKPIRLNQGLIQDTFLKGRKDVEGYKKEAAKFIEMMHDARKNRKGRLVIKNLIQDPNIKDDDLFYITKDILNPDDPSDNEYIFYFSKNKNFAYLEEAEGDNENVDVESLLKSNKNLETANEHLLKKVKELSDGVVVNGEDSGILLSRANSVGGKLGLLGAGAGAIVGAPIGAITMLASGDKKKSKLKKLLLGALTGSLAGAGLGGLSGYGLGAVSTVNNKKLGKAVDSAIGWETIQKLKAKDFKGLIDVYSKRSERTHR